MAAEWRRAGRLGLFAHTFLWVFISTIWPSIAYASPWGRPAGEVLVISRAEYFKTFSHSPDQTRAGRFERIANDTYFEIGLPFGLMAGGKAIYDSSIFDDGQGAQGASRFSEIEAFAQKQILRTQSGSLALKIGVGRPSRVAQIMRPIVPSRDIAADLNILYGNSFAFNQFKIFTAFDAGLRKQFGANADQLNFQSTFGIKTNLPVQILVESFSTKSLRNARPGGVDFDIHRIQPSLIYSVGPRWSIQAGLREELAGRNLMRGRTVFLGVWTVF